MKIETYYIIGFLFIIILFSLASDNYKIIEGLSRYKTVDYTVVPSCDNDANINLPSYGFYFMKEPFKILYFNSNVNEKSTNISNQILNTQNIFNVDSCNKVLYWLSFNQIKAYEIDGNKVTFEKFEKQNQDIADCFIRFMKESKMDYKISSQLKTITFTSNGNNYIIKLNSIDLNFTISGMQKYDVYTITCNGREIYNNAGTNSKQYIYGKIRYDNDPTHFINCICVDYYGK